jgi:hypothetical protein
MSEEIYKSKEEINSILDYMNVILLKLSKKNIKYIRCIEIIEQTKKFDERNEQEYIPRITLFK